MEGKKLKAREDRGHGRRVCEPSTPRCLVTRGLWQTAPEQPGAGEGAAGRRVGGGYRVSVGEGGKGWVWGKG